MAVLRGVQDWFGRVSAVGKVLVVALALMLVAGVYVAATDKPSPAERRVEEENRVFCRALADREAEATEGLHSIGGGWWHDRMKDCLATRD